MAFEECDATETVDGEVRLCSQRADHEGPHKFEKATFAEAQDAAADWV